MNEQDRTPEKRRRGRWEKAFFTCLAETGNVRRSCIAAAISRSTVYSFRGQYQDFRESWDAALQEAMDVLEEEAYRRAVTGLKRLKFEKGKPVIDLSTGEQYFEHEYSDTLLIFLLKGGRPEKFRDRHEVTGANGGPLESSVRVEGKLDVFGRIREYAEALEFLDQQDQQEEPVEGVLRHNSAVEPDHQATDPSPEASSIPDVGL